MNIFTHHRVETAADLVARDGKLEQALDQFISTSNGYEATWFKQPPVVKDEAVETLLDLGLLAIDDTNAVKRIRITQLGKLVHYRLSAHYNHR